MKRVRFLKTRTVQRDGGPTYLEGQIVVLPDDSARHWAKRGVAEILADVGEPLLSSARVVNLVNTFDTEAVADYLASGAGTEAVRKVVHRHEEKADAVVSAPDVAGPDSGDPGERAEHVAGRRRGRPRRAHSESPASDSDL